MVFWMLHVSHSRSSPPRRIDKVNAFMQPLVANFQCSYKPSRELAADETMVGFRGRFGPLQYMPNKPTKYGIKAFTLADAAHGYMLDILVYTGSDTLSTASSTYTSLPQPARVVLQLANKYLDTGHHIFTDRYYTSIPLANSLYQRQTGFTGTIMRNRLGLPEEIRKPPKKLGANEVRAFRDTKMMALEWKAPKGKSCVIMLTTESPATMMSVQLNRNRGETETPCIAALQPVNEWGRSSRPEQCLLLVHQEEPKMVEKTFLLAHRGYHSQQLHPVSVPPTGKSHSLTILSSSDRKSSCAFPLNCTTPPRSWSPQETPSHRE